MRGRGRKPSRAAPQRLRSRSNHPLRRHPARRAGIPVLSRGGSRTPRRLWRRADRVRPRSPRAWAWADLMRRVFDLDVLVCPRCGGRMSVIATIEATDVARWRLCELVPGSPRAEHHALARFNVALPRSHPPVRRPVVPDRHPCGSTAGTVMTTRRRPLAGAVLAKVRASSAGHGLDRLAACHSISKAASLP